VLLEWAVHNSKGPHLVLSIGSSFHFLEGLKTATVICLVLYAYDPSSCAMATSFCSWSDRVSSRFLRTSQLVSTYVGTTPIPWRTFLWAILVLSRFQLRQLNLVEQCGAAIRAADFKLFSLSLECFTASCISLFRRG